MTMDLMSFRWMSHLGGGPIYVILLINIMKYNCSQNYNVGKEVCLELGAEGRLRDGTFQEGWEC